MRDTATFAPEGIAVYISALRVVPVVTAVEGSATSSVSLILSKLMSVSSGNAIQVRAPMVPATADQSKV